MPARLSLAALALFSTLAPGLVHAAPASRTTPTKPVTVSLPDTGVFAPVARQYAARLARLEEIQSGVTAERLRLLFATGRMDEAAKLVSPETADGPIAIAWGKSLLAKKDFATLDPLMAKLEAGAHSGPMR